MLGPDESRKHSGKSVSSPTRTVLMQGTGYMPRMIRSLTIAVLRLVL